MIFQKTENYIIISNLNGIIDKISIVCIAKKDFYLKEIVNIYFNQIYISWIKYSSEILWRELFKNLKKNVLYLSVISNKLSMTLNSVFMFFQEWQCNTIN
jgi:hypothetical protein